MIHAKLLFQKDTNIEIILENVPTPVKENFQKHFQTHLKKRKKDKQKIKKYL